MSQTETAARTIAKEVLASIKSFCAPDATLTGTISSSNPAAAYRLEGTLEGDILFEQGGTIHIAEGAKVSKGRIVADNILIEGWVDAKIHARKSLEITANAVVTGELAYDAGLDIHTNARIRASMMFTGNMDEIQTTAPAAQAAPVAPAVDQSESTSKTPSEASFAETTVETSRVVEFPAFRNADVAPEYTPQAATGA
ncbi:polymer-forming cytoskeletal protein [Acidovorax delafieldii]|jgi:cytoskeletal protein CcmA (bactofilin family)|uniref:bactofilin family protein n=1 Tax=Acidovorax delafieldii TaxID=47920 RepID=UPI003ECC43EF